MEIHPDPAYDDPEENKWVLPSLPDASSVPDNTSSWWILYSWRGEPRRSRWPVGLAITREITPPWRRGAGIMLRKKSRAYAVGVWLRGKPPRILSDSPLEKDWQQVAARSYRLENGLERN
jgi:hypothetical protein